MQVHYAIIFLWLILQGLIFFILLIPFPHRIRKSLINFITESPALARVWQGQLILTLFVLLFLLESIRQLYISSEEHHDLSEESGSGHSHGHEHTVDVDVMGGLEDKKLHMRMYYAERNIFLTGGCLFLGLVLNRWVALLRRLNAADEKLMELTKGVPKEESKKEK